MAHAGIASRRESEKIIQQRRVSVNGKIVTELGTKVDPNRDEIRVDGRRIEIAKSYTYVMLNKPSGMLSVMDDPQGRKDLSDLIASPQRLYPVGRLDASSQGLILLTDDGELANLLTHPRYEHQKEYRVLVNGTPSKKTLAAWQRGVMLDDKITAPAEVEIIRKDREDAILRIVMREGRKRQIRRVASLLGHPVRELTRVRLGPLHLGSLTEGQWRYLTSKEIRQLNDLKRRVRKPKKRSSRGRRKPKR